MTDVQGADQGPAPAPAARGRVGEVFVAFLRLGVTAFGGPIAHLGYFRADLVQRRGWLADRDYGDLVALAQFLPGPASSQVGFGIGLLRAGWGGALAAFLAFTMPSALVMLAVAAGAPLLGGPSGAAPAVSGAVEGLMIAAVAVVAQAVLGMARTLAPDPRRAGIAAVALLIALAPAVAGSALGAAVAPAAQFAPLVAIAVGSVAGLALCRAVATPAADAAGQGAAAGVHFPVSRRVGVAALGLLVVILVGSPMLASATGDGGVALFDAIFRAGALVFGGGHVVLPLLQSGVVDPGWVTPEQFLAGYGAAQALPGPLFAFAAYLGALSTAGPGGAAGAAIALVAIFLPGFLILVGVLPFWNALRRRVWARALVAGAGAAVVGVLAAALYDPVFVTAVTGPATFGLAAVCFVLLAAMRVPPWAVVVVGAVGGVLIAVLR